MSHFKNPQSLHCIEKPYMSVKDPNYKRGEVRRMSHISIGLM